MTQPKLQEIIGYDCEVSVPNGPAVHGYILARWMDEAQKNFDAWLAEHYRRAKAEAWDEGFTLATRNNPNHPHPMAKMNPYRTED